MKQPGGGEEFLAATSLPPGAAGEGGGRQGGQGEFGSEKIKYKRYDLDFLTSKV